MRGQMTWPGQSSYGLILMRRAFMSGSHSDERAIVPVLRFEHFLGERVTVLAGTSGSTANWRNNQQKFRRTSWLLKIARREISSAVTRLRALQFMERTTRRSAPSSGL